MDAVQAVVKEKINVDIDKFVISGASKRGWTSWLTAAIDDRVVGVIPVVLSCLNMKEVFHHYYQSLGGWSFALFDYWSFGLMALVDEPEMMELSYVIDPYYYRQYLTMPKLMISGASDEFFMLDDYDYFYDDLVGDKYIWIIENAGHGFGGLAAEQLVQMYATFTVSVLEGYARPTVEWTTQYTSTGGSIVMTTDSTPLSVVAYSAISIVPNRRDWRLHALDGNVAVRTNVTWIESPVEDLGNGYRVEYENPVSGYRAFYIKATFSSPDGSVFHQTTGPAVVPDNFPYPDCAGFGCYGILV
jgi:PhoPQ-activated pathogenicity-related protein